MLKYQIPFDKELFVKQFRKASIYYLKAEYNRVKRSAFNTLALLILGFIILLMGSELSTLFFVMGIFSMFLLYHKNENYRQTKSDFMRMVREYAEEIDPQTPGIFEFRDDCLRFSNNLICTWMKWGEFKKYKVHELDLIFIPKNIKDQVFVINECEVGKTEFQRIRAFVKNKIP
ncbi:MAG TPA: hypothetical protein PKW08_13065 [Flavobacteriaceae bacterium]|nr:hypothetical protein [Flavobacteriaceae bacterium]HQU22512.1 hypothetical protein [Flavobacteriaceae bacterium]HQU66446.1 hypothetical protein [Flavobacteriaceae bacterium]